jgi:ComF family protein
MAPWKQSPAVFARAISSVGDFLVPPVCHACERPLSSHDAICAGCWAKIDFIRPPLCDRLGHPLPFDLGGTTISAAAEADPPEYDRARAVARFDGVMRELVHALKFRDRHDARRLFGRWLAEAGAEILVDADMIAPVPLSRSRLFVRRFNQAAILAREVARLAGVSYEPQLLRRTRRTSPQVGLSRRQRRDNVSGAFAADSARNRSIEGAKIVLVDDVITTGATVGACAKALKKAGAARVDILSLAMVTDPAFLSP